MDIILSSYYTTKPDPQKDKYINNNNFEYIKYFYNSIKKHNLNCVIFHDNLNDNFIDMYTTDKILFIKINLDQYKRTSLNDIRFYVYYEYIKNNDINNVIFTDISDVIVINNPFDNYIQKNYIYICKDRNRTLNHYWVKNKIEQAYNKSIFNDISMDNILLNAGVIGGYKDIIIKFLKLVLAEFENTNLKSNANMPVINYIIHKYFKYMYICGYPFCSEFFKNEIRNDVYFKHK